MKTIIMLALAATLVLVCQNVNAQEERTDEQIEIDALKERKDGIIEKEKELLKKEVTQIMKRLERGEISEATAEELKKAVAEKHALNIENKLTIIDSQIALLERNGSADVLGGTQLLLGLGNKDENGKRIFGFTFKTQENPRKPIYDRRTTYDIVYAFGWNSAFTEVSDLGDTFSLGESGFIELGLAWNTRLLKNSGALHIKYGFSFQWNKLEAEDNQFFTVSNEVATLETFDVDLKKSRLRNTNLVVPLHIEFGGSKKIEKENYVRYRTRGKFRMGLGGYAGVRLGTQQKLRFRRDGERVRTKERRDFGGDTFVYGLSGYVRIWGDISIYGKYDLSSAINAPELGEVNNVSLGFRFDL